MILAATHPLAHLNAALNTLALVLLVVAVIRIRRGNETAHGKTMIAALIVSVAFLISYVTRMVLVGRVDFAHEGFLRTVYLSILFSHMTLAVTVPVLATVALVFGLKALGWGRYADLPDDQRLAYRRKHRRLVKWAFPIWLYVSVTGVIVYLMLYQLWPAAEG
ncbi:MAG: hypothetical protein CMJ58_04505 [Planctomycetaceae bacterium]|nr:hypothetical protein [Planctomycetaceae bacterium]